ncbi:Nuclear export factor [Schizosaccharomyces pombe]
MSTKVKQKQKQKHRPKPSLDRSDSTKRAARAARFSTTLDANFQALKKKRKDEQESFQAKQSTNWEKSSVLVGTCRQMCPEFELEERKLQHAIHPYELDPVSKQAHPSLAVKAYHRPAAGKGPILPSDVRPPSILKNTIDYLFKVILDRYSLREAHAFVRDRTRAVRQDFSVQSSFSQDSVYCHELIARFHIISLHELAHTPNFSRQQEIEQLSKILYTLGQLYDYMHLRNEHCTHEAEFRAYMVLLSLGDPSVGLDTLSWPDFVFKKPIVKTSLKLYSLAQRNNHTITTSNSISLSLVSSFNTEATSNLYTRFFKIASSFRVSYLMGCLLDLFVPSIRTGALKAMKKCYLSAHSNIPFKDLMKILAATSEDELVQCCKMHGLKIEYIGEQPSAVVLNRKTVITEPLLSSEISCRFADEKKPGTNVSDLICLDTDGSSLHRKKPKLFKKRSIMRQR